MKLSLIFVDDDQYILRAFKRSFRNMRESWNMHFATTAGQALEIIAGQPVDVVLTEIRLPDMDGRIFLDRIKKLRPDTVRIIISGYADKNLLVKSVDLAHQLLAKPCDDSEIKQAISRAVMIRDMLESYGLKKIVVRMDCLPGLPELYTELQAAVKKDNTTVADIADIVARDLGVSAKILKLVNSSFFGLPQHISSLAKAVGMLGMDTVMSMALNACTVEKLCQKTSALSAGKTWEHGFLTANFARTIARRENLARRAIDDVFMAGLMHDIGRLVIAANLPDKWQEICRLAESRNLEMHQAEQQILGASHAVIGAYLIGLWGLPEAVVEAVLRHHRLYEESADDLTPALIISIADTFVHCLDRLSGVEPVIGQIDPRLATSLKLGKRLAAWQQACSRMLTG